MLKYPCLVLDHDDTVVQSEKTIGYPCFCQTLRRLRPEVTLTFEDYVMGCHNLGFVAMCREKWNFTDEELQEEYRRIVVIQEEERQKCQQMEQLFLDAQAGILAKNLAKNCPCPVCGSLVHPKPAEKAPHAPTKEELENKREKIELNKHKVDLSKRGCVPAKNYNGRWSCSYGVNGLSIQKHNYIL